MHLLRCEPIEFARYFEVAKLVICGCKSCEPIEFARYFEAYPSNICTPSLAARSSESLLRF